MGTCNYSTNEGKENTVKFNVGGKIFEVSVSLLSSFPDSLLAQKALSESKTETKTAEKTDTDGSDEEVPFFDRDSIKFQLCLDYMRDGKVILPFHIPRDALLHELDHYGIAKLDTVDHTVIDDSDTRSEWLKFSKMLIQSFQQEITTSESHIRQLQDKLFARKLAHFCALRSQQSGTTIPIVDGGDRYFKDITEYLHVQNCPKSIIRKEFLRFGLAFVGMEYSRGHHEVKIKR